MIKGKSFLLLSILAILLIAGCNSGSGGGGSSSSGGGSFMEGGTDFVELGQNSGGNVEVASVPDGNHSPEPGTLVLFGASLAGLFGYSLKRRK